MEGLVTKKKILVIDDSTMQLAWTKKALGNDYEVTISPSGYSAFEILEGGLIPDLFLLDIIMPDLDGWGVFHKIMGMSLFRNIPIAFFTGVVDAKSERKAFELGIFDYIKKPISKEELIERINKILK